MTDIVDRKSSFYQNDVNNLYHDATNTQNLSKTFNHEHQDVTNVVWANVTVKAQHINEINTFEIQ